MNRISLLQDLLASIAARTGLAGESREGPIRIPEIMRLCHELISTRGEASGVRIATQIFAAFRRLSEKEKDAFFAALAKEFSPDREKILAAAVDYTKAQSETALVALQNAAEPPRQELFRRLNLAAGGTAELVAMREALLSRLKADPDGLAAVEADMHHLFQSWFNRGFLLLRPIDWGTPANILEKIIRYEAVHEIGTWEELRQRVHPADRRCFAFFHPSIPDDPLIFVEVALTDEIPASIGAVLDPDRKTVAAEQMSTAVFYSISTCHKGLAGVSFGSFLIKQVAEDLKAAVPSLKTFVTLSPVPGFTRWLAELRARDKTAFDQNEQRALEAMDREEWPQDAEAREAATPGLASLGARYLLRGKREDGQPLDPVARFHLGNGAILNRVMPGADLSPSGTERSGTLMVNYLYDLPKIEQNHEAYAAEHRVAASRAVTGLLPGRFSSASMKDVA